MREELKREVSLLQATSINMIDMVGIGPFVTIPMVIATMGSNFLWAWLLGAGISFVDAFIWSELGSAYPKAGGSYNFLKEAYGTKWGRLFSFLYVWQTCIQAPLVVASGAIGFSQYASFIFPMDDLGKKILSGSVVILLIFLLYREIKTIGKISVVLWVTVVATIVWIIAGGMSYQSPLINWFNDAAAFPQLSSLFFVSLGHASVKTVYSYLGYYNVCHLGGEIKNPEKNIPKSIFISIGGISVLYLLMNLSIVRVIPLNIAATSQHIVSDLIGTIYGNNAAVVATAMVLLIAFASLFAVMLGYSRIPYAAAADGQFFKIFAKLHPTKNFPHISLLAIGGVGFIFSLLFRLGDVIAAVLAMRIVIQFIGQAIGVVLLRKRKAELEKMLDSFHNNEKTFRMPLYPIPVIIAITIWSFIFFATGITFMLSGLLMITLGLFVFYIKNEYEKRRNHAFQNK